MLGADAVFRPGQLEAIESLVVQRKRLLVVQRTGWGKSLVYFLATRLLRDQGMGPTLLISPLLSLMRNQIEAAGRIGVRAATLNSSNVDEWTQVEAALRAGMVDALLVSPERLANERFLTQTLPLVRGGIGLLAVDEAHCISDWGHDFRPDYRRIVRIVNQLPSNVPVLGTTATANARVVADIVDQLGPGLEVQRGPLTRSSLRLQTIALADQAERLAWLAENVPNLPGSGIIYCLTVGDCERVATWLQRNNVDAHAYHAGLLSELKVDLEQRLMRNQIKALVATVALGMGFDKPDLGFVVHYQRPGSVVAYYQQIGRAGRSVESAYTILLNGREDDDISTYFIDSAFPSAEACRLVLEILENVDSASINGILAQTNLSYGVVERVLKLLEIDGAVAKTGSQYFRTPNEWQPSTRQQVEVTNSRKRELEDMRMFVSYQGCLMEYIARRLDDPEARPCGVCSNCGGDIVSRNADPRVIRAAAAYLRGDYQVIKPRLEQLARSRCRHGICRDLGYACVFDRPQRTPGASGG